MFLILCIFALITNSFAQETYESDVNFRIEPGSRTCFFERGKVGQMMEVQYQVIDGQHGELDISFDIIDPKGVNLVSDYKKSENSIIMDLELDGDYVFCMDNSYSLMNSKLVFVYVLIEDKETSTEADKEAEISVVEGSGDKEHKEKEILEWKGTTHDGKTYYIEVSKISDSLTRTLKHVVRARHLLDIYGASKSRDSYLAFEDTFIVDVWSGFQIVFMCLVGMLQVYMIKQLFSNPMCAVKGIY